MEFSSIFSILTTDSPIGFGRNGERVAKTPRRLLPPSLGGLTVGDQAVLRFAEKPQMSQRWEKFSSPRIASGTANSGSKTILECRLFTSPLCLGIPNFVGKAERIRAIILRVFFNLILQSVDLAFSFQDLPAEYERSENAEDKEARVDREDDVPAGYQRESDPEVDVDFVEF